MTNIAKTFKFNFGDILVDKDEPLGKIEIYKRFIDQDNGAPYYYIRITASNTWDVRHALDVESYYELVPEGV